MTTLEFSSAAPLPDDALLERVGALVGPATAEHQLWIMLVDGDQRQLPTLLPISGLPPTPDRRGMYALERLLGGLRPELHTAAGPGSAFFVLERCSGGDAPGAADREWRDALWVACRHAEVTPRGVFLSTAGGVRRMADPEPPVPVPRSG
jgi:hypothetical protein